MQVDDDHRHALVGDAFGADKKDLEAGGLSLREQHHILNALSIGKTPDVKHNTVSYMKPERLNALCRNALGSNDKFICYAVRKSLLRVIETARGEKTLLRGHSHDILDIDFSRTNDMILCSVDGGAPETAEEPRVIISRLEGGDDETPELGHSKLAEFEIPGYIVKSHPTCAGCFGVANIAEFGIAACDLDNSGAICSSEKSGSIKNFSELPISGDSPDENGNIYDLSFSRNGHLMGVAVAYTWAPYTYEKAGFYCWSVKSFVGGYEAGVAASHMSCQQLSPLDAAFIPAGEEDGPIVGVEFISNCEVVILQHHVHEDKEGATEEERKAARAKDKPRLKISVYTLDPERLQEAVPKCIQSLTIDTPDLTDPSVEQVGTEYDPLLTYSIAMVSKDTRKDSAPGGPFIVITSRISRYIMTMAVGGYFYEGTPVSTLTHLTLLDMRSPSLSADGALILVSDDAHTSDEGLLHLELCCYQENGGEQSTIQQYHVPVAEVSPSSAFNLQPALYWAPPSGSAPGTAPISLAPAPAPAPAPVEKMPPPSSTPTPAGMKAIDVKSLLSAKVMSPSDIHSSSSSSSSKAPDADALPPPAPALTESGKRSGKEKKAVADGVADGRDSPAVSSVVDTKALLSDKKFIQALAKEINTDLKRTVIDTTRKCFQESFAKSLVPAFEAGVTSMCDEIQTGFKGSQGLVQELAKKGMPEPGVSKQEFDSVMKGLSMHLESMTSKLELMSARLDGVVLSASGGGTGTDGVRTPLQLLRAGEISRAMETALELKSIDELLELLKDVKPQVILEKCRKIVVLCTTQQLAVDLSTRAPPEGLETRLDWIKNLVMHVVFDKSTASDTSEKAEKEKSYMAVVMTSVREAIEATQSKLQKSAENGEDVPASAMTDLTLLKNLVQTA